MMKICIILPPFFFNPDSQGFNEMLASEMIAVCESSADVSVCKEFPQNEADIFIMTVQYREDVLSEWMQKSIMRCKQLGGIVMVAGKASSVEFAYILKRCGADFVFLGETEETLSDLLSLSIPLDIPKLKSVDGLAYIEKDSVKYRLRKREETLDDYPIPQYRYLEEGKKIYPLCVMETCRSCHGKCNFCEGYLFRQQNLGDTYRVKSPERVVEEIENVIKTYNCRLFSFSDDNFFADGNRGIERAEQIAKRLIEKKIKMRFTIECRADDIMPDSMALLKKAGLYKVFVGIESGSQDVLNRYNKGISVEQNHQAIKTLNDLHILCHPGHILFDPLTTRKELEDTVSFFESYLDYFFSFNDGFDSRLLFFPHGCEILKLYWPNQSEEFYDNICYNGIRFAFQNPEVESIYNKFVENLQNQNKYKDSNLLKRRIYCLKEALNEIR